MWLALGSEALRIEVCLIVLGCFFLGACHFGMGFQPTPDADAVQLQNRGNKSIKSFSAEMVKELAVSMMEKPSFRKDFPWHP